MKNAGIKFPTSAEFLAFIGRNSKLGSDQDYYYSGRFAAKRDNFIGSSPERVVAQPGRKSGIFLLSFCLQCFLKSCMGLKVYDSAGLGPLSFGFLGWIHCCMVFLQS